MSFVANRTNANAFLQSLKRKSDNVEYVNTPIKSEPVKKPRIRLDKLCIHQGCNVFASVGPIGRKKLYCKSHSYEMSDLIQNIPTNIQPIQSTPHIQFYETEYFKQPMFETQQSYTPSVYIPPTNIKSYSKCKIQGCSNNISSGRVHYCNEHMYQTLNLSFSSLTNTLS